MIFIPLNNIKPANIIAYHRDNPNDISAMKHTMAMAVTVPPQTTVARLFSWVMRSIMLRATIPDIPVPIPATISSIKVPRNAIDRNVERKP